MAKFEGRGGCDCCKKGVDVYSDKNGLAYYNCGPCGFRGLHKNRRTSDAVLAKVDREAEPDDGTAPPPAVAALPAPPAPAARKPVPPVVAAKVPAPTPTPAPKKGGFLSNFVLG